METPAEYMKEWRKTAAGKAALAVQKQREKAKREAVRILIERHLEEYDELLRDRLNQVSSTRQ